MDAKTLFFKAVDQAAACIRHVSEPQLGNDTPCTEWSLKDLLNHMVSELRWVEPLVSGKTIADVGNRFEGDLVDGDAQRAWQAAAAEVRKAVEQADMKAIAHLSYGDRTMSEYLHEVGSDILVHTWDVAQGIRCSLQLDEAAVRTVYEKAIPHKDSFANSPQFAGPLDVPETADLQTKLLALYGRKVPAV